MAEKLKAPLNRWAPVLEPLYQSTLGFTCMFRPFLDLLGPKTAFKLEIQATSIHFLRIDDVIEGPDAVCHAACLAVEEAVRESSGTEAAGR